ncbi:nucleotidyltransferase family protein [Thermodesulfobacteriota bacterium]
MHDWRSSLISVDTPILKVIEVINNSSLQVALVVNEEKELLGMITDGDVRRAILRNIPLTESSEMIMCKNFTVAHTRDSRESIISLMKRKELRHVPVIDDKGRIVDLKVLLHLIESQQKMENWVVLMAGGMGTRLQPMTFEYPKPLLHVGGKPLLEIIIQNFMEYGLYKFFISIHYKASMIEDYFGDGSKWGIEISYIKEEKKLGTAGALSLLKKRPEKPLFVMNSDLLTKVNFKQLIDFHVQNKSSGTMCVKEYDLRIPYGVVNVDGSKLLNLEEKPIHRYFVNAGIYILEPETLNHIPKNKFFDMTTMFEKLLDLGIRTTTFPIHEYWIDIGKMDDYEQANGEYKKHFEP